MGKRILAMQHKNNLNNCIFEEKSLDERVNELKHEIEQNISETRNLLEQLEKASLLNEKIPDRVKHIMEGNRKNYSRKMNQFLDSIKLPINYLEVEQFSQSFTKSLDVLSEETQKSYLVLKEFLESELTSVIRKVKAIENISTKFCEQTRKEKLDKIQSIKEKLDEFKESENLLIKLKNSAKEKEEEIALLKEKIDSTQKAILELKDSKNYKEHEKLKTEKQNIELNTQEQKKKIAIYFAELDRPLRKYKRLSLNEKLINQYLENSSKALLEDKNLEIINILEKMMNSLNKLGLKDKKEEKTREEIKKLDKSLLTQLKTELEQLLFEQKNNKQKLLEDTSIMKMSEQESRFENLKQKLTYEEQECTDINNRIIKTNPKFIKKQIRELLSEFSVVMENG